MRTNYRNGDAIAMTANECDGCSPSVINGYLAHELGCPDAWRDREAACRECGCTFRLADRRDRVCQECIDALDRGFDE